MHLKALVLLVFWTFIGASAQAGKPDSLTTDGVAGHNDTLRTNRMFALRGYAQFRYNRLFETNPLLNCEQCDRSWGDGGGFSARRVRLIAYGHLTPRIYYYLQPDFAGAINGDGEWFSWRDYYVDIGIDKKSQYRFRVGQSKVPFGFENMQSSQNRLPLDRNDALNSALRNERDLGVFFYWAPTRIRELYRDLADRGMKHSGDYGMFGVGLYTGQTANIPEQNANKHLVTRFTYPFIAGNQIIEAGLQGYTGKYVVMRYSDGVGISNNGEYLDERAAASFVLYPQPFGIQAEYNIGRGPQFNHQTQSIEVMPLHGGYITMSYMVHHDNQLFIPFLRAQTYDGGKKHERDARAYQVRELELGMEWQPMKNFELVVMYTFSDRLNRDFIMQDNHQRGRLLRIQAQLNF